MKLKVFKEIGKGISKITGAHKIKKQAEQQEINCINETDNNRKKALNQLTEAFNKALDGLNKQEEQLKEDQKNYTTGKQQVASNVELVKEALLACKSGQAEPITKVLDAAGSDAYHIFMAAMPQNLAALWYHKHQQPAALEKLLRHNCDYNKLAYGVTVASELLLYESEVATYLKERIAQDLSAAIKANDCELAIELAGMSVELANYGLCLAIINDNKELIASLLNLGANITAKPKWPVSDSENITAIELASKNSSVFSTLAKEYRKLYNMELVYGLMLCGDPQLFTKVINDKQLDLNNLSSELPPLGHYLIACPNRIAMLKALHNLGYDVNQRDEAGISLVHLCAIKNDLALSEELVLLGGKLSVAELPSYLAVTEQSQLKLLDISKTNSDNKESLPDYNAADKQCTPVDPSQPENTLEQLTANVISELGVIQSDLTQKYDSHIQARANDLLIVSGDKNKLKTKYQQSHKRVYSDYDANLQDALNKINANRKKSAKKANLKFLEGIVSAGVTAVVAPVIAGKFAITSTFGLAATEAVTFSAINSVATGDFKHAIENTVTSGLTAGFGAAAGEAVCKSVNTQLTAVQQAAIQGSITAGTNSIAYGGKVLQNVLAGSVSGALNAAVVAPLPIDNQVVKAGLSGLVTGGTTSAITGENILQASVSRGIQAFSARAIAEGITKVSSVAGQSLQEVNQSANASEYIDSEQPEVAAINETEFSEQMLDAIVNEAKLLLPQSTDVAVIRKAVLAQLNDSDPKKIANQANDMYNNDLQFRMHVLRRARTVDNLQNSPIQPCNLLIAAKEVWPVLMAGLLMAQMAARKVAETQQPDEKQENAHARSALQLQRKQASFAISKETVQTRKPQRCEAISRMTEDELAQHYADEADRLVPDTLIKYGLGMLKLWPRNHETVIGILKHKSAYLMLEGDRQKCNDQRLLGEKRYKDHEDARPKDKGHVRLDIINRAESTVYDHKFGESGLSADEVDKIKQHAPESVTSIKEVRPSSKGGITEKYPKPKP